MKRKALLVSLLLILTFAIQAKVSLEPNISIYVGPTFTQKPEDIMRSSFSVKAELDPFCININEKHFISFPISYTYVSKTPTYMYYNLNSHMDFGSGIGYRYRFNDIFSLGGDLGFALRYVPEVNGGLMSMDLTAEPWFHINDYLAIMTPIRLGFTKSEFNLSAAIGLSYIPFGGRK